MFMRISSAMIRRAKSQRRAHKTNRHKRLRSRPLLIESLEERTVLSGVYGWTWNDADLDAVWDSGESALEGWTVFLDPDKDGQLDAGETSTTTDANGYYVFGGLSPGEYTVAQVVTTGWGQIWPADTAHTVTISTDDVWAETYFGNYELPIVTIATTDASASEAATDTGTFTITRSGNTGGNLTVNLSISGTATENNDFPAVGTTAIIVDGQSSIVVTVTPVDDDVAESEETVTLTVESDSAYAVGVPNTATVNIADNDVAALSSSIAAASVSESAGAAATTGTVSRNDEDVSSPLTVTLSSSDTSEATVPATVVIPANQVSVTFDIAAVDDAVADGTQTVTILASAANYTGAGEALDVTDDDGKPFQNSVEPTDVNDDGDTTPLDVLALITYINASGIRVLPDQRDVDEPYCDVDGDGSLAPVDVLLVITAVNSQNAGGGDGEAANEVVEQSSSQNVATIEAGSVELPFTEPAYGYASVSPGIETASPLPQVPEQSQLEGDESDQAEPQLSDRADGVPSGVPEEVELRSESSGSSDEDGLYLDEWDSVLTEIARDVSDYLLSNT